MSVVTSWVQVRPILSVWREDGGNDGMRPEHLLSTAAWARQFPALAGVLVAIWSEYYEISPPSSSRIHQRSNFTPVTSDTLLHIHSVIEFGAE